MPGDSSWHLKFRKTKRRIQTTIGKISVPAIHGKMPALRYGATFDSPCGVTGRFGEFVIVFPSREDQRVLVACVRRPLWDTVTLLTARAASRIRSGDFVRCFFRGM